MTLNQRKANRLKGYDYSQNGAYLCTICVKDRNVLLWNNVGADSIRPCELSHFGIIIDNAINNISKHYPNVIVDKYCIMPNHVHILLFILFEENGRILSAPTLSLIIGQMKRYVSKQIGFPIWQKSFNDKIIKDEKSYNNAWQYIDQNPLKLDVPFEIHK